MNTNSAVKVFYQHDEFTIRFFGPVTEESIITLCDEINLALDYYCYQRIVLQIDSTGGSATALDYYIQQLQQWRRRTICFATEALTCAYSAAAIMLSLGDIGHRRAYSTSKLLYHSPRVVTEGGVIDARTLRDMYNQLTSFDDSMVDCLAQHVYDNKILREVDSLAMPNQSGVKKILGVRADRALPVKSDPSTQFVEIGCGDQEQLDLDQIKLLYQTLNHQDLIISAQQALNMLLIDSIIGASEGRTDS